MAIRNARADAQHRARGLAAARRVRRAGARPGARRRSRPAIERLARARPLRRRLTREALHATAGRRRRARGHRRPGRGDRRAGCGDPAAAEADRARLEKELADAGRLLESARARLANEAFTAKAPPAVVEGARTREAELADQVDRLRDRLARLTAAGPRCYDRRTIATHMSRRRDEDACRSNS